MSIIQTLKEWFFPPLEIHDPYGDYVKRKAEKIDREWSETGDKFNYAKKPGVVLELVDKLQTENDDLQHAVEYYEKYLKWLEENYIFILRSPKSLKEDFDKILKQDTDGSKKE